MPHEQNSVAAWLIRCFAGVAGSRGIARSPTRCPSHRGWGKSAARGLPRAKLRPQEVRGAQRAVAHRRGGWQPGGARAHDGSAAGAGPVGQPISARGFLHRERAAADRSALRANYAAARASTPSSRLSSTTRPRLAEADLVICRAAPAPSPKLRPWGGRAVRVVPRRPSTITRSTNARFSP